MPPIHDDDETEAELTKQMGRVDLLSSRLKLVIVSGAGGPMAYPLPADGEVVIGRAPGCTIRLEDAKASRRHAMLHVGRLDLTDLGSANGTSVNSRLLTADESVTVLPGDVLVFGSTTAMIQADSTSATMHPVLTHAYFEARLEDECTRAVGKGGFAVLRVRVAAPTAKPVEPTFEQWMAPMDVVATYAPQQWEFLLVDVSAEEARARASSARKHLERASGPVEMGMAIFPSDGKSAAKLIAASGEFHASAASPEPRVHSSFLDKLRPVIERVASGTISVLIGGETGAGKEVLARAIHRASPRAKAPMVCLNCASFTETLLESELFGYERGAFTGATQSKAGLLESADGGTVFLDEIGEMPLSMQAKLLRVIEERQIQRVGSLKPRTIDVRFLSATNRDLEGEIQRGAFRQDLYYRLNGVLLTVPPLRERVEEIEGLARAFLARSAERLGAREPRLSEDVLAVLREHAWPGNIRELRNVMERAVLLCNGDLITLEHVPHDRMRRNPLCDTLRDPPEPQSAQAAYPTAPGSVRATMRVRRFPDDQVERAQIVAALEACAGNQTQAAKVLGISRNTLIARLDQYELSRPRKRE